MIRVVDFETNGMEPPSAVLEAGTCGLVQRGEAWDVGEQTAQLFSTPKLDPGARAVHHITYEVIEGKPVFDAGAFCRELIDDGVLVIAAHVWDFEGKWLTADLIAPMRPLCTWKAALRIWPDAPSHSNGALRYWLEEKGEVWPDHAMTQPAHRAGPDAYTTAWLVKALLTRETARQMVAWTKEPALLPKCPIGKDRGKLWADVDGGFLQWMMRQDGMEADLKWLAQRELDRRAMDQRGSE